MADPDLIQLDGFAIGWFARMLSHYKLGTCIALAVGQGHLPPRGAPVFVDVGEAAGGGILPPVMEHPEAQCLLIEGERLLHVPYAEGHMRHPYSWHNLSFPCEATLATALLLSCVPRRERHECRERLHQPVELPRILTRDLTPHPRVQATQIRFDYL